VFESQEMKGVLAGAISRLGERQKIVIAPYDECLTLAEIGQVLASPSPASARCTPRRSSGSGPRCRTPASCGPGLALPPRRRQAIRVVVHNLGNVPHRQAPPDSVTDDRRRP
jgi:hypothetical protein